MESAMNADTVALAWGLACVLALAGGVALWQWRQASARGAGLGARLREAESQRQRLEQELAQSDAQQDELREREAELKRQLAQRDQQVESLNARLADLRERYGRLETLNEQQQRQAPVAARHAGDIAILVANLTQRVERFRIDTQVDLTRRPRRSANC